MHSHNLFKFDIMVALVQVLKGNTVATHNKGSYRKISILNLS